jgi:hypothetical protein
MEEGLSKVLRKWGLNGFIELVQENDSRVVSKASYCSLHFDNTQMCLARTTMEKTVVEELNHDLICRICKPIPAGDAYCEHIIEIRSPEDTPDNGYNQIRGKTHG